MYELFFSILEQTCGTCKKIDVREGTISVSYKQPGRLAIQIEEHHRIVWFGHLFWNKFDRYFRGDSVEIRKYLDDVVKNLMKLKEYSAKCGGY